MVDQVLGKGLSALIGDNEIAVKEKNFIEASNEVDHFQKNFPTSYIKLDELMASQFQPRRHFEDDALEELTESIKENGVLQPIIVRPNGPMGRYEVIAGERRWRAAKEAGLDDIPAIVKICDDRECYEIALVENIQRQNLTPIEEAEGYRKLQEECNYTQEKLSESLGKSRSHITNMLRLLKLPTQVKDLIDDKSLSVGHARALINSKHPIEIAEEIIRKDLSVREAEKFANGYGKLGGGKKGKKASSRNKSKASNVVSDNNVQKDDDIIQLERIISDSVEGLKVSIDDTDQGGVVKIFFNNLSELDKILQKF